jgi:hypothetical protein
VGIALRKVAALVLVVLAGRADRLGQPRIVLQDVPRPGGDAQPYQRMISVKSDFFWQQ